MSLITISSENLSVTLDSLGAVFHSIVKGGTEYLWQGDKNYWGFRDKNLFPYVGRLTDDKYIFNGQKYSMTIHGFANSLDFLAEKTSPSSVTFSVRQSEDTLKIFPFSFLYEVIYSLSGSRITKTCRVTNTGGSEMYFGLGSHPGFNVPLGGVGCFEDWYFDFSDNCAPFRIGFDNVTHRLAGNNTPYPLVNGKELHLQHSLFDNDAIVLSGTSGKVTLKSALSPCSVTVSYPGMKFLGFWHMPKKDAPYVCIEPWVSLPSHSDYIEDITLQENIIHLPAGQKYVNDLEIEIV